MTFSTMAEVYAQGPMSADELFRHIHDQLRGEALAAAIKKAEQLAASTERTLGEDRLKLSPSTRDYFENCAKAYRATAVALRRGGGA